MDVLTSLTVSSLVSTSVEENTTAEDASAGTSTYRAVLKTLSDIFIPGTLVIIMLGMGSTINIKNLWGHLRRPIGPAVGMLSQFIVLPLVMFGFAHLLQLDSYAAIGLLVLAASPGGSTSNLFSYWADGDVPLSLTMTTLSTVLALGMMPLNIWIYSRSWVNDKLHVPYVNIFISLVATVVPAAAGIFINWKWPNKAKYVVKMGSYAGVLAVAATLTLISLRYPYMYKSSWKVYAGAFLLPFIGFAFGYIVARVFRLNDILARTVALETGIQNFPLCMTVISLSFPSHVISKLALCPLLAGVFIITNSVIFLLCYLLVKKVRDVRGKMKGKLAKSKSLEEQEAEVRTDLVQKI